MTATAVITWQQRRQLFLRLSIGMVFAILFNVLVVTVLSMAVDQKPETQLARRIHRVSIEDQPQPTPQQQQKREQKKQDMKKLLASVAPRSRLTAQHAFSMPAQIVETMDPAQWQSHMDVGAVDIGELELRVDQHARLKFMPDLDRYYPRIARRKRISGESLLELHIDEEGHVAEYTILSSQPDGVFERSIPPLIPHIRYEPARQGDQAVSEVRRLKLKWSLE